MSGWLPPGTTDKDIDDAAGCGHEPVQCDNCLQMFCPECDEDSWIGFHESFGDCCQCGKCINQAYEDITGRKRA